LSGVKKVLQQRLSCYCNQFPGREVMEVDFEFEVGPSKEGVQLSIKSRMGRVLKVTSIEMTEREALRLAEVLTRSVQERQAKALENPPDAQEPIN
jgi:hypothetical protein